MKYLLTTLCASLVCTSFGAKLPPNFKKCNIKQESSQQCLTTAVENAIRQMNRPFKELGLLSLDPFEIPSLIVDAGTQLVNTKQIFKNLKLSGFNETSCSKAEFDFGAKTLNLNCIVPNFRMDFNYEVHGQILLMSVYGKGTGWVIFHDSDFDISFNFGEYEKKGRKYFNIVGQQLSQQTKHITFDVTNLFDGDEESADRVKKVIRENALEIFDDVKPGYEEAFGKIFAAIFDRILTKVPVFDIFGFKE